jgi:hypothetical protein
MRPKTEASSMEKEWEKNIKVTLNAWVITLLNSKKANEWVWRMRVGRDINSNEWQWLMQSAVSCHA